MHNPVSSIRDPETGDFQRGTGRDDGENQLFCEALKRKEGTEFTG